MTTILDSTTRASDPEAESSGPGAIDALAVDATRFNDALGELVRVIQFRDRDRACCHDLSVSQCYALAAVIGQGGPTVNDLAAELYLDKSTASRIANGLEERGLVERRRDPQDGRAVRLHPTPEGEAVHARIDGELVAEYAAMLQDFDPATRQAVVRLLRRLTRSFSARVDNSGGSCCVVR